MNSFGLEWRRRWQLRRTAPGPLRDYFAHPFPAPEQDYRTVGYVAVDLETTGLDPHRDQILSLGWVVLDGPRIDLGSARHQVVRVAGAIPAQTAIIHQITDDQAAAGQDLGATLPLLLAVLAGRVLIAHHAKVELGFLGHACQRLFGSGLLVRTIDTQVVARRLLDRRAASYRGSDLRLHRLAERFNLPRYNAHNALSDALTAAELFLAQAAYRDSGKGLPLADFLC